MEFKFYIAVLWVSSCACSVLATGIETIPVLNRKMGEHVTLTCEFTASDLNDWMFIKWTKAEGNSTINLASYQNNVFTALWSATAPENFMDHVQLEPIKSGNRFELNLAIDAFDCPDAGEYTCEVYTMSAINPLKSTSVLHIEVNAGMPSIYENVIEVKENDTFNIECTANVGLPPQTISWSYKKHGASHIYYTVTDGITQKNTPGPDCTTQGVSTLKWTMAEEYDMTTFLCHTPSELGEDGTPKNFDEVMVQIYGKTTTTTSTTKAPSTTQKTTVDSGTSTIPSSVSAIIICCLVTAYTLITGTS